MQNAFYRFMSLLANNEPIPAICDLRDTINNIVAPILGGMVGLAAVFAIYLGVRLATADDEGKRKNVKGQLVYTVLGIFIVGLIVSIMLLFVNVIGAPECPTE